MSSTPQEGEAGLSTRRSSTFGHESVEDRKGRDRWPSRVAFYLAAIGSAIGFGNVWRFPALAADYGGGAFFIPYLLALFLIGLPVLILEISLGQVHQTGNIGVFGSFHARFRGVGMASVACAFILVVYYSMLLGWVTHAFFDSFGSGDPWAQDGMTGGEAVKYFFSEIVGMDTLGDNLRPTRLVGANVGYVAIVWFAIFLSLAFGLMWTGRVVYVTMGLPILFLFIFLFKSITLTGAEDGIELYIGKWDMDVLTSRPDVWSTAVSQIFFSMSVVMGTMTAYGSHCPKGEPAFLNSIVIGISNSMFSFISGFAVFAAMGHAAHLEGKPVEDISYSTFSLVFGTWPVVFGTFKGGEHWVRLLFLNLFLLGIDSAFSILEGPMTVAHDYIIKSGRKCPKWQLSAVFCTIAYLCSLMYATDAGLIFLDTVDFYINFVLLLIGFFETFGAGWVYGIEDQIEAFGPVVVFTYMFTNFGSIIVACAVWFGVDNNANAVWGGFVALAMCYITGMFATFILLRTKINANGLRDVAYDLALGNVMRLRADLQSVCGYVSVVWAVGIKQFIPHVLLILFINLARSNNSKGESLFGHYEGYVSWPFQILGMLIVAFAAFLILIGWGIPTIYEGADLRGFDVATTEITKTAAGEEADLDNAKSVEVMEDEYNKEPKDEVAEQA